MVSFRQIDLTEKDYEKVVQVWNDAFPRNRRLAREVRHQVEETSLPRPPRRFLGELADGTPVAQAFAAQISRGDAPLTLFVQMCVRPVWRRQGIGAAFDRWLAEYLGAEFPAAVVTDTMEDEADGQRFINRRGFKLVQRSPVSEVDVGAFDSAEFMSAFDRVAANNLTITTFQHLVEQLGEKEAWSQLYQLRLAIAPDIPSFEENRSFPTEEEWVRARINHPSALRDGTFIGLHRDHWVGVSQLYRSLAMPELLDQGITGVRRAYRRMGLATALKLRTLDYAKRYGASVIRTDNEENNPMYQLNLRLGFRPKPGFLVYEKKFRGA